MFKAKVVRLSDITNTALLFQLKDLMLGDKTGDFVVQGQHAFLGRYISQQEAQDHVDVINSKEFEYIDAMPIKDLLKFTDKLIREGKELLDKKRN